MSKNQKLQTLSEPEIWNKITAYCAYRERSRKEVMEKLYGYGLNKDTTEIILKRLESEKYVDEGRFAGSFAGGKFRVKSWGRRKIENELKAKGVATDQIQEALGEIKDADYQTTLLKLSQKKETELLRKEPDPWKRQQKVAAFLIRKGYEPSLVFKVLKMTDSE